MIDGGDHLLGGGGQGRHLVPQHPHASLPPAHSPSIDLPDFQDGEEDQFNSLFSPGRSVEEKGLGGRMVKKMGAVVLLWWCISSGSGGGYGCVWTGR